MRADRLVEALRDELADAGLSGSFLARNLRTGEEIGFDAETLYPIASLAKLPLAIVTQERIERGEIDGAQTLDVAPGLSVARGTTGISRFRHTTRIAVDDLLYLAMALSDNEASDALFRLTPPEQVGARLARLKFSGIWIRRLIHDLVETPAETLGRDDVHLAHALAITAGTDGRGHLLPQLDVTLANTGTARAFINLLADLWNPTVISPAAAARVRELLGDNIIRWRLAPEFVSDSTTWSSKTGTLLNLRHEVGVVEHSDGGLFAVAALTESHVAASIQPGADATMGRVARALHDHLRRS